MVMLVSDTGDQLLPDSFRRYAFYRASLESGRDQLLVMVNGKPKENPLLTVDLYVKWYSLHLVLPDGSVQRVTFGELEPFADDVLPYVDHTPNPTVVEKFAAAKGYDIDELAFEMMVGRWKIEREP